MKTVYPNKNYIVFDFETTGLDPMNDTVIQMSAIKLQDGLWQNPFNRFIKQDKPLPAFIKNLTQITDELLEMEGVHESQAWIEFSEYTKGFPMIGHNIINFDNKFLNRFFAKYCTIPAPHPKNYIDTAMIYKAKKLKEQPYWYENHYDFASRIGQIKAFGVKFNLQLCAQELDIDLSLYTAHRSDGDIAVTNLIYEHFLKTLEKGD